MYIVRLKKARKAFDFLGNEIDAPIGRRVRLPIAEAFRAADAGEVELLSPDALKAYANRDMRAENTESKEDAKSSVGKRLYRRRDQKAE